MKKSDLKPGMVVKYRDGRLRLVLPMDNLLFLTGEGGHTSLTSFDDNLCSHFSVDLDVMKVYSIDHARFLPNILDEANLNLLWERPEEVTITMQEIADKFDIPIEQIRIKK